MSIPHFFSRTQDTTHRIVGILLGTSMFCFGLWVSLSFMPTPIVEAQDIRVDQAPLQNPLVFVINRTIRKSDVLVSLTPAADHTVTITTTQSLLKQETTLTVTPTHPLNPGTTYTVTLTGIRNTLGTRAISFTHTFTTDTVASITGTSLPPSSEQVAVCTPVTAFLSKPHTSLTEFSVQIEPRAATIFSSPVGASAITVDFPECLQQETSYTLLFTQRLVDQDPSATPSTYSYTFSTKAAPVVSALSPSGTDLPLDQTTLKATFTRDMEQVDPNGIAAVSPPLAGTWSWENSTTLVFSATQPLAGDTTYTISVSDQLKSTDGGFTTTPVDHSFSTIGPVTISAASPSNGSTGVTTPNSIVITFDQAVIKSTAEARFSISPAIGGSFSWRNDRTLAFSANFQKDSSYSYTVTPGVESSVGQALKKGITNRFSTEESSTLLAIPNDLQDHSLSCEIASLKMTLTYRGLRVSESELIGLLPVEPAARVGNTWADPDLVFVGNIDGEQNTTGYGVHADPIAKLANQYRSSKVANFSLPEAAQEIANGNPIIIWGLAGPASRDTWQTPAGRTISTWRGEHVRVLIGFTGSAENPTRFIINDPIYGRLSWTASQLSENWGTFANRGVVIY